MLSRLVLGEKVLIAFEGGTRDEFSDTLFFRPPFGPYPKELKETFPIGPSELPEWDDTMVRTGCRGIRRVDGEPSGQPVRCSVQSPMGSDRQGGTWCY